MVSLGKLTRLWVYAGMCLGFSGRDRQGPDFVSGSCGFVFRRSSLDHGLPIRETVA